MAVQLYYRLHFDSPDLRSARRTLEIRNSDPPKTPRSRASENIFTSQQTRIAVALATTERNINIGHIYTTSLR